VRERIRPEQVSDTEATIDYVRWFMRTADALDDYVPSVADQFTFARLSEEENVLGPQGRLVALVNMGLAVLAEARRDV
jgi:hypothetical protein